MTGSAKRKGDSGEREIVSLFDLAGFPAHRIPLSGAVKTAGGRYAGDVKITLEGVEHTGEVKRRADGFREDYKWLEESDMLFKRADRKEWLVTLPLKTLLKLYRRRHANSIKIAFADRLIKAHVTQNGSFNAILEDFKAWGKDQHLEDARGRIEEKRR